MNSTMLMASSSLGKGRLLRYRYNPCNPWIHKLEALREIVTGLGWNR